ncbi:craniofacial development protein 2-like [Artemia franciscana]|uniref:craniofacial development protein 2-like n=1 Tax=Artemia franciscana TaxID=6661 RepID=UPI0032DBD944
MKSDNIASDPDSLLISPPSRVNGHADDVRKTDRLNLMDRRGLRIATWNVLTLNAPASKNLLSEELRKNKVSIAGLTETRLTGSGEERIGNSDSLLWSGGSSRRNGVGLALNSLTRKALLLHEAVSDRLMKARFGHKHGKMTVIVCYAPTNDSDDATKEDFYSALSRCLVTVPPHDITVLLGDFNATVHDDMGLWRGTVGPVSPHPLNDNGLRLLELCRSHDLYIANTYFQRKTFHQYTWYSNDSRTKKMFDYVIVSKRWRSLVKNCRTYRSAELGNADQRLVCADLRLRLHAQRSKRKPVAADIGKLKEPDTRQKYNIKISNGFEALGSLNSNEDLWKHFKLQTSEAAQLVLGKRSYP